MWVSLLIIIVNSLESPIYLTKTKEFDDISAQSLISSENIIPALISDS